jgi:hypothetical protein
VLRRLAPPVPRAADPTNPSPKCPQAVPNNTDEDKFASYGPDGTGKIIQIRASDGEHFTPAGELLVAAYVLPKISASLVKSGAKLGEACAS